MKGFVPVTKEGIIEMLSACREETDKQRLELIAKHVGRIIKREQERTIVRRWYRLWTLPAARFAYNEPDVIEWANALEYAMFDESPFKTIEKDYDYTIRWIDSLLRVANSNHAGEPIELDINTFERISSPELYLWVSGSVFYRTLSD